MTGCNVLPPGAAERPVRVSIHSRPHDRLQPWPVWLSSHRPHLFQSTAGPMTGCNDGPDGEDAVVLRVSIHSRPHDRLQPARNMLDMLAYSSFNPQPAP